MNARQKSILRRTLWTAGALCATGMLMMLPMVERDVAAHGPANGENGAPTPLPLIVVQGAPTPAPVDGPRLDPPAIPHTNVLLPLVVYDQLLTPPPLAAQEANAAADAIREPQEAQGRGITTGTSAIASGITLFAPRTVLRVTYLTAPSPYPPPTAVAAVATAAPVAALPVAVVPVAAVPVNVAPVAQLPTAAAPLAPTAVGPRTILSPARLGLPTPQPTQVAPPPVGIRDPGQPVIVQVPAQIPTVAKETVLLEAQTGSAGPQPLLPQYAAPLEAAPGIPSAHTPPVIVVEPGGASVPTGAPVPAAPEPPQFFAQTAGKDIACNTFNQARRWASRRESAPTDMWSDWYAGWGPFAVDDGFYQARNVTFSLESAVGPGSNAGPNEHSAKIASNQPYAAGFGSPLFGVPPGALITVSVNYLIYDHNDHGYDYDWASLGIKPDAYGAEARYVNGYVRGQWATLTSSVVAGANGRIMVLIQAQSPGALNSNIYFDNVRIWIDGAPVVDCAG